MKRRVPSFILGSMVLASCGGSDPEVQVAGTWEETYECTQVCDGMSSPLSGTTTLTLSQDGATLSRSDDNGARWSGELSGREATFTTEREGYEETSTFTFEGTDTNPTRFTVESAFSSTSPNCTGTCTGTGTKR